MLKLALLLPLLAHAPASALPASLYSRAAAAELAIEKALALEGVEGASRDPWARRMYVWSFYESSFVVDALGTDYPSCGVMQVVDPWKYLDGATCEKVRADAVLGYRVGFRVMKRWVDRCPTLQSALTAYATGKDCPSWTLHLVNKRMKLAGEGAP